jgi:hypothetical protein
LMVGLKSYKLACPGLAADGAPFCGYYVAIEV